MSSIWGNKLKISIFGESHGEAIGVTIDGFPSGFEIDYEYINHEMDKRRPGKSKTTTQRSETDEVQIISGIFNGYTTGSPITAIIKNQDRKSKDYEKTKNLPRPSHSDYPAYVKYNGFNDYRGGGHFSGRLTAPLVFAGALCKSYLEKKHNILVFSHINQIYNIIDDNINESELCDDNAQKIYTRLSSMDFPTLSDNKASMMKQAILDAKDEIDSIGGTVETFVLNMPAGVGEPMFDSIESRLSHMMFSIPAVKGIEFGEGFNFANLKGSQANDSFYYKNGEIKTRTNHNGGILGGLTTSMAIIFKTCIKPTPSISQEQETIDLENKMNSTITIEGRHDPCIVQRAIHVINNATAIVLMDFLINNK